MKKIYNFNMNIVKKHMDETGVLKAEPLKTFYAVLLDDFQRMFGVQTRIGEEVSSPDGKGTIRMVLGFEDTADSVVPIMLTWNHEGHVVFVKTFDPTEKLLEGLAKSVMRELMRGYPDMGVEITIQNAWLELRFFHIMSADLQGFEYNGLHFIPTDRKLTGDFREITRHLRSTSDSRLRKYNDGDWNINDFYDKACKAGGGMADTFKCLEFDKEFCPGENELFVYEENL